MTKKKIHFCAWYSLLYVQAVSRHLFSNHLASLTQGSSTVLLNISAANITITKSIENPTSHPTLFPNGDVHQKIMILYPTQFRRGMYAIECERNLSQVLR
jgi:hypothetical protein